jgi:nitroreductase
VALCLSAGVFAKVGDHVQAVAPEGCWLCGHCVAVCPTDAIAHSDFNLADCPVLDEAALPSLEMLVAVLRERRSARVFRDKPVPRPVVRELVDLSCWAPTASNRQPVDWLAFDDPQRIAALSAATVSTLVGPDPTRADPDYQRLARHQAAGRDPVFLGAPVLLLAHVPEDTTFGRDAGAYAAYNLMLGAERMGLGTCLIGYFVGPLSRSAGLRSLLAEFGLPAGRRVEIALVLGYPRYRFRRLIPRRRRQLLWNGAELV